MIFIEALKSVQVSDECAPRKCPCVEDEQLYVFEFRLVEVSLAPAKSMLEDK